MHWQEAIDDKQEIYNLHITKWTNPKLTGESVRWRFVFSEYYFYLIAVHETDGEWKESVLSCRPNYGYDKASDTF